MLIYLKPKLYKLVYSPILFKILNAANCDKEKHVIVIVLTLNNTILLNNYMKVQHIKEHLNAFHVIK